MRRVTPRLPDASGPNEGIVDGSSPAVRLILLGESTVAGIGAPTHEFALAGQTAKAYTKRTGRAVQWLALGRSGANARVARKELAPKLTGRTADAVVIALGVNDAIELNGVKRWTEDMRQLIIEVQRHMGNARLVISGPPPLENFPAFPNLLKTFLGQRSKLIDHALVQLVPTLVNVIHAPMLTGLNKQHFCEDGFHPSVEGYAAWGEYLSRFL